MLTRRKFIIGLIETVGGFSLASCGGKVQSTPTSTPTLTATDEPTATTTIEPTATATLEPSATPVPTAMDIARGLGLSEIYSTMSGSMGEMHYGVEHTYSFGMKNDMEAIKDENGNWKAIKEASGWRGLNIFKEGDAEIMCGEKTPKDVKYIKGDWIIIQEENIGQSVVCPVFTGDWFKRETKDFEGNNATLYYGVGTVRFGEEQKLQSVVFGYDYSGLTHSHVSTSICNKSETEQVITYFDSLNPDQITSLFKVGTQMVVRVPWVPKGKEPIMPDFEESKSKRINNDRTRLRVFYMSREPEKTEGITDAEAWDVAVKSDDQYWLDRPIISHMFYPPASSNVEPLGDCL